MSESRRRHRPAQPDDKTLVAYLRERVYVAFTGLAIVLALYTNGHATPRAALWTLALGVLGVTIAAFASEVIAHLAVHQGFPDRRDFVVLARTSLNAVGSALIPLVLLVLSALDVLEVQNALLISAYLYVGTLGLIGWLAVRKARLTWQQQILAILMLLSFMLVVIVIQVLAHSH